MVNFFVGNHTQLDSISVVVENLHFRELLCSFPSYLTQGVTNKFSISLILYIWVHFSLQGEKSIHYSSCIFNFISIILLKPRFNKLSLESSKFESQRGLCCPLILFFYLLSNSN
jgi:hypothetical protein